MNYFSLFLLLSSLQHVCCNPEEENLQGLDYRAQFEFDDIEQTEMEHLARTPKVLTSQGCMGKDAPPLHPSIKSDKYTPCDERGCVTAQMKLISNSGLLQPSGIYLGRVNTTESGRACRTWSNLTADDSRNWETYQSRDGNYGEHNNCRPSPTSPSYIFCFTTDPKRLHEGCEVPRCLQLTKGER